jgi:hypothetical protein
MGEGMGEGVGGGEKVRLGARVTVEAGKGEGESDLSTFSQFELYLKEYSLTLSTISVSISTCSGIKSSE